MVQQKITKHNFSCGFFDNSLNFTVVKKADVISN